MLGGLSMGGYIAFAFWRRHAARVRALMLMDTKASADTDTAKEKRRELIATVQRDGVGAVVPGMIPSQLGETTRRDDPALVERVEVMLRRAPASGVVAAAQALMDRTDSTPTLATITVPTLVLVGDEDTVTPIGDALDMAAAIRGSRLVTVPGAGHLAPLEQPAIVNAAIAGDHRRGAEDDGTTESDTKMMGTAHVIREQFTKKGSSPRPPVVLRDPRVLPLEINEQTGVSASGDPAASGS